VQVRLDIEQGQVLGTRERGVCRFLGVPYAAAPFGDRRMRPPAPPARWRGIRDATCFGPTVPKSSYPWPFNELFDEPEIAGEECLNLNIWTPEPSASLPVFVWVHGGAFVNGSGAVPQYDGTAFARDGVVTVTINYRLGADGFLDTGDEHTNIGILDQLAALRWVQEHIQAFGGDPGRVTVGGESAGAMSVATLLGCPASVGLFGRAVLQSGAGHHALTRPTAQRVAAELASRLGVPTTRQGIASVPLDALLATQAAVSAEIQQAPDPERWAELAANRMPFEPVIDGSTVPALPIERVRSGAGAEVPVLIGTNRDENLLFLAPSGALDAVDGALLEAAAADYGFADPAAALAAYREAGWSTPGGVLAALSTDWMFRIPAIRFAEARHAASATTHVYEFCWPSPVRGGTLGACHFLEIPFVFDTLATPGAELFTGHGAPQALADEVHGSWVRFISGDDPGWQPYTPDTRTVRIFGGREPIEEDPGGDRRALWDGLR
jgi:para-nitrobenzyl esterase